MTLSRRMAVFSLLAASMALPWRGQRQTVGGRKELLLVDASLGLQDLGSVAGVSGMSRTHTVQGDLVRQWRDGLHRDVVSHAGPVVALVRWDKALLLSDLSREAGLRSSSTRVARSVFRVDLFP